MSDEGLPPPSTTGKPTARNDTAANRTARNDTAASGIAGVGPGRPPGTASGDRQASPDADTVPLPAIEGTMTPDGNEPPRESAVGDEAERRRIPWPWIAAGLVLLVLAGRGLVAAGHGPERASPALATEGPTPTAGAGPPAERPGASATVGPPTGAVPAEPTEVVPTASSPPKRSPRGIALAPTPTRRAPATPTARPTSSRPSAPTRSEPTQTRTAPKIVGVQSGKCINVTGGSTANRTRIDLFTCNGSPAQAISHTAAGELRVLGKCIDAMAKGTVKGTPIILYTCNGQLNQKWTLEPDRTIRGVQSHLCLDAAGFGTGNGTLLQLWFCSGGPNQAWIWSR